MALRGTSKSVVQALLIGVGVGLVVRSLRKPSGGGVAPPDCSSVGPSGGTVAGVRYLESVTAGGDPSQPLPMLVVFHSRGASASGAASFGTLKTPVRVIRPEGTVRLSGGSPSWFTLPSKTSDQAELQRQMVERADELGAFIGALMQCRPTAGLPVVTGTSEGAHVSYLLASRKPGLVRGAVAVLGWIPQPLWNPQMAPTIGLHGTSDNTVPYQRTVAFWEAMKAAGAPLTVQSFPGGHGVSSEMGSAWRAGVRQLLGVA